MLNIVISGDARKYLEGKESFVTIGYKKQISGG
jgi:hypothetical protein